MGGTQIGSRSGTHFSTQDYEQIGKVFCETLLDFFDPDPIKVNIIIVQLIITTENLLNVASYFVYIFHWI